MNAIGYLIRYGELDGPWNMAIDEVLWRAAAQGTPFLRLYGWADRPSLSLGYFQSCAEVRSAPRWRNMPFVRRITGGGTIVHDRDLTYSLALPAALAPPTDELYRRVHQAVARALGQFGIPANVGNGASVARASDNLCFQRQDRFAVRVAQCKILGSAQRRQHGSVLMHGSLLLARSTKAPQIPGLAEVTGSAPSCALLSQAIAAMIQDELELDLCPCDLPRDLRSQAARLVHGKYGSVSWNERR